MSIVYIDGFDHLDWNNDNASIIEKWYHGSSSSNYLAALGPSKTGLNLLHQDFGGTSFIFYSSNVPSGIWRNYTATQSGIVGFHYYNNSLGANNDIAIFELKGLTQSIMIELQLDSNGRLYIYRGSTILRRTMGFRLKTDEWYYIELQFYIANSIPANTFRVWVNGQLVLNLPAGTDTQAHSTDNLVAGIGLRSNTTSDRYWDNFYWARMTGVNAVRSPLNSGGGGIFIQTLYPTGTGDFAAWSGTGGVSHWRLVDEHYNAEAPDGDTTYLETAILNDKRISDFREIHLCSH